ncbi:MAG: alpha/beta hydrolase [Acidobacteriia bacterium]|jgi:pimeloyl-ACP methyl ester carboxylesterase|nr:alpha/beta hydrolase [Terriglobia bacterium]
MRLEAWQAAGRWFRYRGHAVFYRDEGRGEALLCLHGFPTASWDWHRIWPELTRRFRVIAPDFLGFGFSDKPRHHPYSIFDQATLVESLLCALRVRSCHLLAHDYGATVAQELLARFLQRRQQGLDCIAMDSVCLLNGGLFPEAHRPLPIQRLLRSPLGGLASRLMSRAGFRRSFSRIFAPANRPSPAELEQFWTLVRHGGGARIAHRVIRYLDERRRHRERWVSALQHAMVPVRLIWGLDDPVSGAGVAARYRQLIAAPDLIELAGVGHYPQLEAPAAVLAGLQGLLERCRRTTVAGAAEATSARPASA